MFELSFETYISLQLSRNSSREIDKFLNARGISAHRVDANYHVTLAQLVNPRELISSEVINPIQIPVRETRFMILVLGGADPDRGRSTEEGKLGVRFRQCAGRDEMQQLRKSFLKMGDRRKGLLPFQLHMSILKPNAIESDHIRALGEAFRATIRPLVFDRLLVATRLLQPEESS